MAHMIDTTTGQAAMFSAGQVPWHGLGKVIAEAVTSQDAIRLAVLDWLVRQEPLYLADGREVPERVANVREDTGAVLGVVGSGYRVFQNRDAFAFMDAVVEDGLATYETAGAIKNGKVVWMLARLPGHLKAGVDDVVEPYVLLTNGHDGAHSLRMLPTTVRVVCNNTLNLALGRAGSAGFTLHHSKNLETRVEEARKGIGLVSKRVDQFQAEMDALASVSLTDRQAEQYFRGLFPRMVAPKAVIEQVANGKAAQGNGVPADLIGQILAGTAAGTADALDEFVAEVKQRQDAERAELTARGAKILDEILGNYHGERCTLPGVAGTAWAAFNAVTDWADHQSPVRGKGTARAENRMNSAMFGAADELKQRAFTGALALAQ